MGGGKDPEKKAKGTDLGYNIDDILEKAKVRDDKAELPAGKGEKDDGKPEPRIERVSELVEGDFEVVDNGDEEMDKKDEAIQNYIMDLEADLDEKIAALDSERDKRAQLEAEVEELKKGLDRAQKESDSDDTVQGYLADLEADLKVKIDELERERKERERLEGELKDVRSKIDSSSRSQTEVAKIRAELDKTRADGDVEIARLETEQTRKELETESHKTRVAELEDELKRKIAFIEEMRSKTAESEASIIDTKERVKALEGQLDSERRKGKEAHGRAEDLAGELTKMRDTLSMKVDEVEKAKTDLHTLEAMRARLDEASSKLDQESQERVRAESEIGTLRGNLSDIMQNMQTDLAKYRDGQEQALKDLEEERGRRAELEKELKGLRSKVDASASETQKELADLKAERDRLVKETGDKQRAIETEMAKCDLMSQELAEQRRALVAERNALESMRAKTEKENAEQSSDHTLRDVKLQTELEGLKHEKDQAHRKDHELAEREKRLAERERAIRDKETKLRNELRSKALGIPSAEPEVEQKPEEPVGSEAPEAAPEEPGDVEGPAPEETPAENVIEEPAGPRIWPPLSSQKGREAPKAGQSSERAPDGPMKMGLPSTYIPEKKAEKKLTKKERRQLLWPDHAYEAEARLKNVSYEPSRDTGGSTTVGTRHLINNYVAAKSEPVSRPTERAMRCVCGAEFYVSTSPTSDSVICPKCGRRLI
jgi:chromosome segregation ATPase